MAEKQDVSTPRLSAIALAASTTREDNPLRAVAYALIHVGDSIASVESPNMDRVATELGGVATAISDLAGEVGRHE